MHCNASRRGVLLALTLIALTTGCTLVNRPPESTPIVITATLSDDAVRALTPSNTPTRTPSPMPTDVPTATEPPPTQIILPSPTTTATYTPVPTLAPTRTVIAAPTAALPLDDGSGRSIAGTGAESQAAALLPGLGDLPESLYFLAPDAGGVPQVYRLRVGFASPDQVTLSPTGVSDYAVAQDGTLAYITPEGLLFVGGVPVTPSAEGQTTLPRTTSLAWSPVGGWLAFTVQSIDAATTGEHPVDGLWLRSAAGSSVRLLPNTNGAETRVFTGPLRWRPNGSAFLARHLDNGADTTAIRWSLITVTNSTQTPLWNDTTLPTDAFTEAAWDANGSAILASGADQLLRIDPATLGVQILLDRRAGYAPAAARPRADGSITFVGQRTGSAPQLFALLPGQSEPVTLSTALPAAGTITATWDSSGTQALVVLHDPPDAPYGTPFLIDSGSIRHDLSALTGGTIRAPQWSAIFKSGDRARVQTARGEPLNLRTAPNGSILTSLAGGSIVIVRGGPTLMDGMQWWQVQTPDRVTGWVVAEVRDAQGTTLRTLLPSN